MWNRFFCVPCVSIISQNVKGKTNKNALLLIENDEYNNKSDIFSSYFTGICDVCFKLTQKFPY